MSCFRPLNAYRTRSGEVRVGWDRGDGRWMELACGKCIGCRLERARAWKVRILHEAQLYDSNLVLTLTYADEFLPRSLSLEYPDFQGFMKRLRRRFSGVSLGPDGGRPVRFFVAGEYGGMTNRPHFHAILFNFRFPDMIKLQNGFFSSRVAEQLWRSGNVVIDGSVTPEGAAYVAGYVLSKQYRHAREDVLHLKTGELTSRRKEFVVMSRRPGIGAWWYERFASDLFPQDHAVSEGKEFKVPRFYLERYKLQADGGELEEVLEARYDRAALQRIENSRQRRAVREEVAERRSAFFNERGL